MTVELPFGILSIWQCTELARTFERSGPARRFIDTADTVPEF